jgi:aspartate/tyrosine/aromatic aminotransferase
MLNTYNSLPEAPLDPIMLAAAEWTELQKTHDDPINTTVGVLNDPDSGKIWRPLAVEEAFIEVAKRARSGSALGYQTQAGNAEFLSGMARLVFGDELAADLDGNSLAFQGLGGTGALSLAGKALAALLRSEDPATKPTLLIDGGWPNHPSIFQDDFTVVAPVRTSDNSANHDMMMEQMHLVPERTALLLQACGYNDDGIDRTDAQWNELLLIAAAKDLPVIMD